MSAAAAEAMNEPQGLAATMLPVPVEAADTPGDIAEDALMDEIRLGFDQLRGMTHDELRDVVTRRVRLLETELKEREERRAAIETARLAARMLELRRERALRINRRVNLGSALAAVASTVLVFAVLV